MGLVSDHHGTGLPIGDRRIIHSPLQMGGVYLHGSALGQHLSCLKPPHRLLQVLHIEERDPEQSAHGGAHHLRRINIRAAAVHQDAGGSRRLCRPKDGPQVSRILQGLQNHQKRRFSASLQKRPQALHPFLPGHRQDPLGRHRVGHLLHFLLRHQFVAAGAQQPFAGCRVSGGQKLAGHENLFRLLRRQLPAHFRSVHHIEPGLPPGLWLLQKLLDEFFLSPLCHGLCLVLLF